MAMTLRLPEELQKDAQAYAASVGVPLTGVIAIALRQFLDERRLRLRRAALQADPPKLPKVWEDEAVEARAESFKIGAGAKAGQREIDQLAQELATRSAIARGDLRADQVVWKAPKSPRAPCPCGSGEQWRHCHREVDKR